MQHFVIFIYEAYGFLSSLQREKSPNETNSGLTKRGIKMIAIEYFRFVNCFHRYINVVRMYFYGGRNKARTGPIKERPSLAFHVCTYIECGGGSAGGWDSRITIKPSWNINISHLLFARISRAWKNKTYPL